MSKETSEYSGVFNATIHVVVGGGGAGLSAYTEITTSWSIFKDYDHGFGKLTAYNKSTLQFEYKKSSDGLVYDSFWIRREYKDVIGCDILSKHLPVTFVS